MAAWSCLLPCKAVECCRIRNPLLACPYCNLSWWCVTNGHCSRTLTPLLLPAALGVPPPPGVSPALCSAADKPGGRKRRYGLSGAGAAAAAAAGGGLDVLPSALLLRPGFQPPKMRKGGS